MTVAIGTATAIAADRLQTSSDGEFQAVGKIWVRRRWALACAGNVGVIWRMKQAPLTGDEPDFLARLLDVALEWANKPNGAQTDILACHPDEGVWCSSGTGWAPETPGVIGFAIGARAAWHALGQPIGCSGLRSVVGAVGAAAPGLVGLGSDAMWWAGTAWVSDGPVSP